MNLKQLKKTFIGDKAFYKMVLAIVVPIIIQNAITNFVGLLDNIMVGQIGTDQMSGVAIANQLIFVFNLSIFGGIAGAGIFVSQFHGAGDPAGVRSCFRYKIWLSLILFAITLAVFIPFGRPLISLFLTGEGTPESVEATLNYGMEYLRVMLWGLLPFAIGQVYAGTLRETGETKLPMRAGIVAVFVNLLFNYLLIYGKFGFPMLGVKGAAIATVLSRFVELGIMAVATHTNLKRYPFAEKLYSSMRVPARLTKDIFLKGMPLLLNETLWSMGMSVLTQCYSVRGLHVIAALNICRTFTDLFCVEVFGMGSATAIIVGQTLGSGDTEKAREQSWQLMTFGFFMTLFTAAALFFAAPLLPRIYNTTADVRDMAVGMMRAFAYCMPVMSIVNTCYFVLRSGGKTVITFIFDCGFTWVVNCSTAWLLVHLTNLNVVLIYFLVQSTDVIKAVLGCWLMKKGVWIHNMVNQDE